MAKLLELLHVLYELVLKPLFRTIVRYLKARGWDILTTVLAWVFSKVLKPLLKVLGAYALKALGLFLLIVLAPLTLLLFVSRRRREKRPEEAVAKVEDSLDVYDDLVESLDRDFWEGEAGDADWYGSEGYDTEQE